jgi:hypothetical protein
VNTTISIAGSASEAIIISRLEPMPPKLVPTSRPASDQVGGIGEDEAGGEGRNQRRRDPRGGEHEVGRDAEEPRRRLGQHDFLAQEAREVPIRLQERRPLPAHEMRLHPAHVAREQRREREHQHHLHELDAELGDYCHTARTMRSMTSAEKTSVR